MFVEWSLLLYILIQLYPDDFRADEDAKSKEGRRIFSNGNFEDIQLPSQIHQHRLERLPRRLEPFVDNVSEVQQVVFVWTHWYVDVSCNDSLNHLIVDWLTQLRPK